MDMNEVKSLGKDLPDPENFDKIVSIDEEKFNTLLEEDKQYVRVQQAIMYIQSMNVIETTIFQIEEDIRHRLLTTPENIKIISSRISDIKEEKIQELDMDFVNEILTVDGEKIKVQVPELGGINETEYANDIEFYKLLISYIKIYDENLADARSWLGKVKEKYEENVDSTTREILSSFDSLSKYIDGYFKSKLNDPNTTEEQKKNIEEILQWSEYGITLEPIYTNLEDQYNKKGSLSSIFHNYRKNLKTVVEGAYKVCDSVGIRYPYKLIDNVEAKIFTEEEMEVYKDYKFLLMYIVSRYIKYLGASLKPLEKIFLNQMISNLVIISREDSDTLNKGLLEKMKPNIKKILDFVITHKD